MVRAFGVELLRIEGRVDLCIRPERSGFQPSELSLPDSARHVQSIKFYKGVPLPVARRDRAVRLVPGVAL